MTDRETVHLILRPEKTGPYASDPYRGLRAILKRLLRDYGWRCVGYGPSKATEAIEEKRTDE